MSKETRGSGSLLTILLVVVAGWTLMNGLTRSFGRGLAEGGFDGRVLSPGNDVSQQSGDGSNNLVVIGDHNAVGQTLSPHDTAAPPPSAERNPVAGWGALVLGTAAVVLALWMRSIMKGSEGRREHVG